MPKLALISLSFWVFLGGCTSQETGSDADPRAEMRHGVWYAPEPSEKKVLKLFDSESKQDSIQRGRDLFLSQCMACHGSNAKGDGVVGKVLSKKPANLQALAEKFDERTFFMQISQGKGPMPGWKDVLTKKQIGDLANYLRSLAPKSKR